MKAVRNVSPLGDLEVPLIADTVPGHSGIFASGEVLDLPSDVAGRPPSGTPGEDDWDPGEGLLAQVENFVLADGPQDLDAMTVKHLRKHAESEEIDLDGASTKADILTRVREVEAHRRAGVDRDLKQEHVIGEPPEEPADPPTPPSGLDSEEG